MTPVSTLGAGKSVNKFTTQIFIARNDPHNDVTLQLVHGWIPTSRGYPLPAIELTYPTTGKRKSSTQKCIGMGYVSSQEGILYWDSPFLSGWNQSLGPNSGVVSAIGVVDRSPAFLDKHVRVRYSHLSVPNPVERWELFFHPSIFWINFQKKKSQQQKTFVMSSWPKKSETATPIPHGAYHESRIQDTSWSSNFGALGRSPLPQERSLQAVLESVRYL